MLNLLIAEDTVDLREMIDQRLQHCGYKTTAVSNGLEAVAAAQHQAFDLALIDLMMPQLGGLEVLKRLRKESSHTRVIMMTAYPSISSVVESLRSEVTDYLLKPFTFEELEMRIRTLISRYGLTKAIPRIISGEDPMVRLIGTSEMIQKIDLLISKIAPTDSSTLLLGESGTGKEVVAHEIHRLSARSSHPFVVINCAAIAEGLLESELFGHEPGAFSGALERKMGLLEAADRGTLFLDEIGELSPTLQVKLLRFLDTHELQRLGSNKTIRVDTRIIAATNRPLQAEVAAGRFRHDLWYRLVVFEIHLPPLRKRRGDIPILLDYFLAGYMKAHHKKIAFTARAWATFFAYQWPGNVRELKNTMERLVLLASDQQLLDLDSLPPKILGGKDLNSQATPSLEPIDHQVDTVQKNLIEHALATNCWNQIKTAQQLGIKRTTLQYRIKKLGIAKK